MLYTLHAATHALMAPSSAWWLQCARWLRESPTPGAREFSASLEVLSRLTRDYPKPSFGIEGVREWVQKSTPFCVLRGFERPGLPPDAPTVFVVAPMSGHHATLLRDTVKALAQANRVFITDWVSADAVPLEKGPFGLDDYVATVRRFWDHLGASSLHVLAVCQPVVPVLAAAALNARSGHANPATLTLMGGPVDARQGLTDVTHLATAHPLSWFQTWLIHSVPWPKMGWGRPVYPGFLQHAGFMALNPSRHRQAQWDFFNALTRGMEEPAEAHRRFYDEYNAVADLPAEFYLDTIRVVFQEHLLPRGLWEVAGHRVDLAALKTPLLTLEGSRDDISGPGQTHAAQALCSTLAATDKEQETIEGAGHYGLFSGRRWREQVCPRIEAFMARHSTPAWTPVAPEVSDGDR